MNSIYFKALKHIQTAVWRKGSGKGSRDNVESYYR